MKQIVCVLFVSTALVVAGCSLLETAFSPTKDPVTGEQRDSPAVEGSRLLAGPYDELILGAIIAAQNAYLLKKKRDAKKAA